MSFIRKDTPSGGLPSNTDKLPTGASFQQTLFKINIYRHESVISHVTFILYVRNPHNNVHAFYALVKK